MNAQPVAVIIDDEIQIRRLLRLALESYQYKVFEAETGQQGLSEVVHHRPDVILLDLGLPDMEGLDVLKRLREWNQTPILILSVRESEKEKVAALDRGADDYVTKPFNTSELMARLRAIQRRSPDGSSVPLFESGPLCVDFSSHTVSLDGKPVSLTATEYALLKILVRNAGKVVTQRQILREVWGPKSEEQAQYVRVYITHLRKKLKTSSHDGKWIKTEPGIGYRWMK